MNEMLQRVARHLCCGNDGICGLMGSSDPDPARNCQASESMDEARRVIALLREPTEAMTRRALPHMDSWSSNLAWWQAMIDAALSDG